MGDGEYVLTLPLMKRDTHRNVRDTSHGAHRVVRKIAFDERSSIVS